ncbi:MAG TPA: transcriptional repressor [Acidobacteriaceae bacterium]|nr:transcriptional repressor [Acidobacteriaceae bacterium]
MESKSSSAAFRAFCSQHGLAATHQRQILFEVVQEMEGHPSPEEIYARVRRRIPSISLATVYKNLHLFVESGIVGEVSLHHGSLRIETNRTAHHHLVCRGCKSITDLDEKSFRLEMEHDHISAAFQVERYSIEVVGLCPACKKE